MRQINTRCDIYFVILPMRNLFTTGIGEASYAAGCVCGHKMLGMPYDIFPGVEIDHEEVRGMAEERGKTLILVA
jgi:hypothetical protein